MDALQARLQHQTAGGRRGIAPQDLAAALRDELVFQPSDADGRHGQRRRRPRAGEGSGRLARPQQGPRGGCPASKITAGFEGIPPWSRTPSAPSSPRVTSRTTSSAGTSASAA